MSYVLYREEFEFGIVGRVVADDEPLNPRLEYDNVTTMACAHSRYTLGDKGAPDPAREDFVYRLLSDAGLDYTCEHCEGTQFGPDGEVCEFCDGFGTIYREDTWEQVKKHYYIQALYLYDHSGISISSSRFSCPWDSGQVGYQYVLKSKAHKEWGTVKYERVDNVWKAVRDYTEADYYELMDTEVEEYDDYLTGNCWGFVVEDESGEELDSCWGFLGDSDYCIETMRTSAKHFVNAKRKEIEAEAQYELRERAEREYWETRDVLTVH